ncbi:hypothetical protein PSQ19_11140 [Devosia algicola]|uniref:Uncharacterized protein n=1 Tax=Devosia algicola TaxID=3026418 RepID=A0ABY7YJU9_9HYPH|nr:hypothetical protein [Devosia algicola]WDR01375.1 hypothetical protein PSQ19_11140 [Devosia algicola]
MATSHTVASLSFAWLSGTVMTGLTSVLLMGAALYVSFQGQNTFSTAYEALRLAAPVPKTITRTDMNAKSDRVRPVAHTRSELETIEASIRETVDGRNIIRKQPFMRIRATLATAGTALSADIPTYDPVAILNATTPASSDSAEVNTDIYGAEVEGEVAMKLAPMPASFVPPAPSMIEPQRSMCGRPWKRPMQMSNRGRSPMRQRFRACANWALPTPIPC